MPIIKSTATNHRTMLDALHQALTRYSVTSASSVSGGSSYVVGDVLTLLPPGSNTVASVPAQVEVTSVSGGAITGFIVVNAGVYAYKAGVGSFGTWTSSGGSGTGATFTVGLTNNGWTPKRSANVANTAQSATVAAGGTGYALGDVIEAAGGSDYYVKARFRVTGVSSGAVTSVSLEVNGDFGTPPSNPVATSAITGTGSSCTLNVTYATAGSSSEREVVLMGTGNGGTDQIFVGARSYYQPAFSSAKNWELAGFTGFDPALAWDDLPGISPGRYDSASGGCFVPLESTTITYWLFVTPRRVIGICKIGTTYSSFHFGLLDQFGTDAEIPYPLFIAGGTNDRLATYGTSDVGFCSFANPQRGLASLPAAALYRGVDGAWTDVNNAYGTGALRAAKTTGMVVSPTGALGGAAMLAADSWYDQSSPKWSDIVPQAGTPGTASATIARTTASPAAVPPLFPLTLVSNAPAGIAGQIHDAFWLDVRGGIVSEDVLTVSGTRYRVFQSANQTDPWMHFAVKEA